MLGFLIGPNLPKQSSLHAKDTKVCLSSAFSNNWDDIENFTCILSYACRFIWSTWEMYRTWSRNHMISLLASPVLFHRLQLIHHIGYLMPRPLHVNIRPLYRFRYSWNFTTYIVMPEMKRTKTLKFETTQAYKKNNYTTGTMCFMEIWQLQTWPKYYFNLSQGISKANFHPSLW